MASTDPDIATDPLVAQLTDALRAGPGSPEWHTVVTRLRREGVEPGLDGAGEQRMLVAVRELLEQGKDYRAVRAGPGFTRKLMDRLDTETAEPGQRGPGTPTATLTAIVGGLVIATIVAGIAIAVIRSSGGGLEGQKARLRDADLRQTLAVATFDGTVPAGWETIGDLPLDATAGLRVASTQPASDYRAGGIVATVPVAPGETAAIEALVRLPSDPQMIVQLFVRDGGSTPATPASPGAATHAAAGPGELVWVLQEGKSRVTLPSDGQFTGPPVPFDTGRDGTLVRVAIGERVAIVTTGGREVYAGPSSLSVDAPRTFGIRFITKGTRTPGEAVVLSARVVKQ
jgi:hypothetical protein